MQPLIAIEFLAHSVQRRRVRADRTRAARLGVAVRERDERLRRNVSQISQEVHALVVAEEHLDPSSCPARLGFEAHQQVHHVTDVGSAVQEIPGLNEARSPADPAAFGVDEPRRAENRRQRVERAVNVADGDEPIRLLLCRRQDRRIEGREGNGGDGENGT